MRTILAILGLSIGLAGCATDGETLTEVKRPLRLERITLTVASKANDNWPVPVELVRVQDATLIDQLLRIEAQAWFDGEADAFRKAHPEAFFGFWEVVPGTVVGAEDVEIEDEEVAGVLFCGLRSNPTPPLRFERDGDVTVHIDDDGCRLSGGEPSKEPGILPDTSWGWLKKLSG
jgi:hypothetical protein